MKKNTGFFLLATFSLLVTAAVALHGCGTKEQAGAPMTPTAPKFTIVGSGS
ncbi:MAG TPA: hypothetical protein VFH73_14440 [Polyangia bacterium]|jgi:hypothetical protein|nr:hypothetical protein [Polyangia bacterium]